MNLELEFGGVLVNSFIALEYCVFFVLVCYLCKIIIPLAGFIVKVRDLERRWAAAKERDAYREAGRVEFSFLNFLQDIIVNCCFF